MSFFKKYKKGRAFMIIDLFIATFAVFIVVFAVKKQIKSYKKNGFAAICSGSCVSCEKNCNFRKN